MSQFNKQVIDRTLERIVRYTVTGVPRQDIIEVRQTRAAEGPGWQRPQIGLAAFCFNIDTLGNVSTIEALGNYTAALLDAETIFTAWNNE